MFRLCLLLSLIWMAGCAQPRLEDHSSFEPLLDVDAFFDGELTAHGVVRNRAGNVIRTFSADISTYRENGDVILDEHFEFNDGETDRRVWRLSPQSDNAWGATAGDVIGEGQLRSAGNALYLEYVLRVPYGDGTIDVRVDDRMYLLTPDMIVNQSKLLKFGIEVGSILLVIVRSGEVS